MDHFTSGIDFLNYSVSCRLQLLIHMLQQSNGERPRSRMLLSGEKQTVVTGRLLVSRLDDVATYAIPGAETEGGHARAETNR